MKISDYKLAYSIIKMICRKTNIPFLDLSISFSSDQTGYNNGLLYIGETKNIGQVIYNIIYMYLLSIKNNNISNNTNFWFYLATKLRNIIYRGINNNDNDTYSNKLSQQTLPWLLLKDVVCPTMQKPLSNIKLIFGVSPYIDIVHYFQSNNYGDADINHEPFIYINNGIADNPYRQAALCVEAIVAHDMDPVIVMKKIFDSPLSDKVIGLARLCFHDEHDKVDEFIAALFEIMDLNPESFPYLWNILDNKNMSLSQTKQGWLKIAQGVAGHRPMLWWYLGLYEKMLEPARGPNWSVYQDLHPYLEQFWNEVEKIKEKKGKMDGVPFDVLLRLKTKQTDSDVIDYSKTLQSLLSEQRVW